MEASHLILLAVIGLQTNLADLDGLSKEKADLLAECSFLLKKFDLREESAEIDALGELKAILGGMK